jgi:molecular chaperone Hsp33
MKDADTLSRFLFEHAGIRGHLVHLDASWRAVLETHPYPLAVGRLLGESLAAVALLAATIKLEGSLILQLRGSGPIRTLVAQATHARTIRGLAHWEGDVPEQGGLSACFGEGYLVLTVQQNRAEPYQGVVSLTGADLAQAIEGYFAGSEQLATRLWLSADGPRAAGLLLQRMPGEGAIDEDWARVCLLAQTLTSWELLNLPSVELLHRLFNEEDVRLFEPEPIAFRCGCSRDRVEDTLRMLGKAEVDAILAEQGAIEITCEFCNRAYRLDAVDTGQVLCSHGRHEPSRTHH